MWYQYFILLTRGCKLDDRAFPGKSPQLFPRNDPRSSRNLSSGILYTSPKNTFQKLHFPENHLSKTTLSRIYILFFSRNYISLNMHLPEITFSWTCIWQKLHFPERALSRNYTCLNMHLPECTFSWKCTFQNLHFPEHTLIARNYISPNAHLAEITFGRNYISPKTYLPEFTLARMYIWPKLRFPENLLARTYTCQNVHLAEITFSRKLIFQKSHFLKNSFSRNYFPFEKLYYV